MRIPESVRIAGVEYPVCWVPGLNDGKNMLYGQILYENPIIERGFPCNCETPVENDHDKITLIHEVLHGIIRHYGIECESEEKEEYLVEKLAYGLFQVLADNEERLFGTETQSG